MFYGVLILLFYIFLSKDEIKRKQLAAVTILAVTMHFVAGRYGWYNRYEIYILAFELTIILYLTLPLIIKKWFSTNKNNVMLFIVILLAGVISRDIGKPYIYDLFTIPTASNNIYEQQYQMHRFIADYYQKPVALNDLGYVSYQNSHYVLDLWGLGSQKALKARLNSDDPNWAQALIDETNVGLVMIYDNWFNKIPSEWLKVGELHLGKQRITPAKSYVTFYATNKESYSEILKKISAFSKTLPAGVTFKHEKTDS